MNEPRLKVVRRTPEEEYQELRRLLLGDELSSLRETLDQTRERLDDANLRAEETSHILPAAAGLSAQRSSGGLRRALQPVVEESVRVFAQRNPQALSDALFPVLGPAIRKAVAAALRQLTEALNRTLEQSLSARSLAWRWEALRAGKSFGEIALLRSAMFRVEEVFLIHRETGLLLAQTSAPGTESQDATLVSAMLTAIRDFVGDAFPQGGGSQELETIQFGELSLWIQSGPQAYLACAVRGSAPVHLRSVLQETLERIHLDCFDAFQRFHGDPALFEPAQPHLANCLLGQAPPQPAPAHPWRWIFALAVLLVAAAAYFWWRQESRWQQYLAALRAQPGFVVTQAGGPFWARTIEGFRDPYAAPLQPLLDQHQLNAARVRHSWTPFQSLHPPFAARRELARAAAALDGRSLFFEEAQTFITPESSDGLERLSRDLQQLAQLAAQAQQSVRVELAGDASIKGQMESNRILAQQRAEYVQRELIRLGVPGEILRVLPPNANIFAKRRVVLRVPYAEVMPAPEALPAP